MRMPPRACVAAAALALVCAAAPAAAACNSTMPLRSCWTLWDSNPFDVNDVGTNLKLMSDFSRYGYPKVVGVKCLTCDAAWERAFRANAKRYAPMRNSDFIFVYDPLTNTQGVVMRTPIGVVVLFRGTEPEKPGDLITDLSQISMITLNPILLALDLERNNRLFGKTRGTIFTSRVPGAHRGFAIAVDRMKAVVVRAVERLGGKTNLVHFTGHSLGGALSVLMAATCAHKSSFSRNIHGVYTFGAPRYGNKDFATRYSELGVKPGLSARTYRVVFRKDIIASLPPPILGWADVGRLVHIRSSVTCIRSTTPGTALNYDFLQGSLDDHAAEGYSTRSASACVGSCNRRRLESCLAPLR